MNPRIRSLEAFPVDDGLICVRDPVNFSDKVLVVPENVFFILTLFDGNRTIVDIQEAYSRRFGDLLFTNKIEEILDKLDTCLFLENDRFEEARNRQIEDFYASEVRPASHAGTAYEADRDALSDQLGSFFDDDPAVSPSDDKTTSFLKGFIAPHIDVRRGSGCFARTYSEVGMFEPADTYVILGISHMPTEHKFVLTRKDFDTPLGRMETDKGFVDELARRAGPKFFEDEFTHKNEHSVEFQVIFLQHLFSAGEAPRIVPILCSSFHEAVQTGSSPMDDNEVRVFIDSLKAIIDESENRVCCIAGVDLSHIGRRFGQDIELNDALKSKVRRDDLSMLEPVLKGDADAFFGLIQSEKDGRNVCGVPAIYTLLKLIGPREGRLLDYSQAVEDGTQSIVTFTGIVFDA